MVLGHLLPGQHHAHLSSPGPPGGRSCRLAPLASFRPTPGLRPDTHTPLGTSPYPLFRRPPLSRRGEMPPGRRSREGAWRSPPSREARRVTPAERRVNHAQPGVFCVEAEDAICVASLDGVAQDLEVRSCVSLSPRHDVHLLPPASSGGLRPTDEALRRGPRGILLGRLLMLSKMSQTNGTR